MYPTNNTENRVALFCCSSISLLKRGRYLTSYKHNENTTEVVSVIAKNRRGKKLPDAGTLRMN